MQLQEKCQQYSRLAQDLQITSDEALDFEFKLRERESYLESEIQVRCSRHNSRKFFSGFRIRILDPDSIKSGSGFVPVFGIRIRIQEVKNEPQK